MGFGSMRAYSEYGAELDSPLNNDLTGARLSEPCQYLLLSATALPFRAIAASLKCEGGNHWKRSAVCCAPLNVPADFGLFKDTGTRCLPWEADRCRWFDADVGSSVGLERYCGAREDFLVSVVLIALY